MRHFYLVRNRGPVLRACLLRWSLALCCAGGTFPSRATEAPPPAVIPNPTALEVTSDHFTLRPTTAILIPRHDAGARQAAHYLQQLLQRSLGWPLALHERAPDERTAATPGAIVLRRLRDVSAGSAALAPEEGYHLRVAAGGIDIDARTDAGLLYGAITLWQLAPVKAARPVVEIPGVVIDDAPRLRWRGLMLDSARHFQSVAYIRRFLDWMALHKLNVLHWHLTDDQAWRLEIKRYPRLTEIGAWRVEAGAGSKDIDPRTHRPRRYGGYYSQAEVRALIAYAAARNISIVPEIEMPGHAVAAIVAYPELSTIAPPPLEVPSDWGIYDNPFNLDDSTFQFLERVLGEVIELFPSPYIHVGGDEVDPQYWHASSGARARAQQLGLTQPRELQPYFMQRIERFLIANGRRPIGWDETLQPGLPQPSIIMSWHGTDGGLAAAQDGHDAVLAPWPTLYFDNRQGDSAAEGPGRRVIPLQDVYRFEPLPRGLEAPARDHILGLEGAIWTEHVRTEERVSFASFPRAAAVAEIGWSPPERREWSDFLRRLAHMQERYRAFGWPHAETVFAVRADSDVNRSARTVRVSLSTQGDYGEIHYTLDGSAPSLHAPRYRDPLTLALPSELRASSFGDGLELAPPLLEHYDLEHAQRRVSQQLQLCTQKLPLALEDDAPLRGPRAVFWLDIENPCWIFEQADLSNVAAVRAGVGQVPFNFQIGAARAQIPLRQPETADGELQIRLDRCDGTLLASLPLAPATHSDAVTELPEAPLPAEHGRHDLCLQFTQRTVDPMWALDWVELVGAARGH